MEGQVPGRTAIKQDVSQELMAAETMADVQNALNDNTFTSLTHRYEETNRMVNFLENALDSAKSRQAVLAAAIDRLNAPTNLQPSLR